MNFARIMKIVLDTNVLINGFKDEYSYEKKIIDADLLSRGNRSLCQ